MMEINWRYKQVSSRFYKIFNSVYYIFHKLHCVLRIKLFEQPYYNEDKILLFDLMIISSFDYSFCISLHFKWQVFLLKVTSSGRVAYNVRKSRSRVSQSEGQSHLWLENLSATSNFHPSECSRPTPLTVFSLTNPSLCLFHTTCVSLLCYLTIITQLLLIIL